MAYTYVYNYAYACMESLHTSYTHKHIIIHRNSIVHIIMDPVPKDELAIQAGKTAETIFSVDNTSDLQCMCAYTPTPFSPHPYYKFVFLIVCI